MEFNFGDKILWKGKPAVFMRNGSDARHCISYHDEKYGLLQTWVDEAEIIHVDQVCDYPKELTRNIRDKMILIFGQLLALQYGCDSNTGHALESIGMQYERVLKTLFKDYE